MSRRTIVALMGAGIMGAPMARNIARAGFAIRAWNRTPEKVKALLNEGVSVCATPFACVADADVVILMLSTGAVCDEVLFGADGTQGVAPVLKRGAVVVVMSSIPVETAQRHAERLKALGCGYVDAPVSGGERGAIEGNLSIMAGGAEGDLARVLPVLSAMGRVTHVGPCGAGQLAKIANQLIVGVTIGAVAEALLLVEKGGGDAEAVHRALQGGFADSTVWRQHGRRMIERNFKPGAYAHVQLKDLDTARDLAASLGLDLRFGALARDLYARMCETGGAALDHSALYLELAEARKTPPNQPHALANMTNGS
ncbi:MAG: NAD(P)-dependent oxidoreductase [Hyphomonadaceae bacterium]|nr:NAD(P)-dependent oxidoreductase [Hyphomonadaceae bacterium]